MWAAMRGGKCITVLLLLTAVFTPSTTLRPPQTTPQPPGQPTNPVPTWHQVFGHRTRNTSYTQGRSSWPNKPPLQNATRHSTVHGKGLLLHLSLPPTPLPQINSTGPPPQQVIVDKLMRDHPNVSLVWMSTTHLGKCPAENDTRHTDLNGRPLSWPATNIGDSALPVEACLDSGLQPVRRPCLRDLTFGAQWGEPTGKCDGNATSVSTAQLLAVAQILVTPANAANVTGSLASALALSDSPSAGDVMLVADALAKVSKMAHALSSESMPHLANLMDGVLKSSEAPDGNTETEHDAKATKSILNSMDAILAGLQLDGGLASAHAPRAALLVADVAKSGVTGVAAMSGVNVFDGVRPLLAGEALNSEGGPEVAARLLGEHSQGRASFVLIGTSRTFPQRQNSQVRLNSRVIGVTLSGEGSVKTGYPCVEIELRPLESPGPGLVRHCAYWDLEESAWSTQGCRLVRQDVVSGRDVCQCTHLTHFGEILGVGGQSAVLDAISLAGCALSLLGILGIALTAAFFRQWRSRLGNKILLHLSGAIGLSMAAFLGVALGGSSAGSGDPGCIILGALLHYSVLAAFCWMLVSASLQMLRFVVVVSARPPHFLLKGVLVGWGVPLIPVAVLLIAGPYTSYVAADREDGAGAFCYPRGMSLVLAVIVPVTTAVLANLIVFCIIVYRVSCGRDKRLHNNVSAMSERRMAIRQLRMSILLFFLLGLSWIFGLLALLLPNIDEWRLIFSYLFCATATLQGLALFLFFVVWERKARALWLATLPESFVSKRNVTSESTSGMSPSTGTSNTRQEDEAAPLRHRTTEQFSQQGTTPTTGAINNGYHSADTRTYL